MYKRQVYSEFPIYPDHDENIISDKPGMFPDLLSETPGNIIYGPAGWSSLWITVCAEKSEIGSHYISLRLKDPLRGEILECGEKLTVNILPEKLNGNKLICTDWLHTDCLAEYYNTEVFSTEYWRITENFVKSASKHGINMMLTPVFTPVSYTHLDVYKRQLHCPPAILKYNE